MVEAQSGSTPPRVLVGCPTYEGKAYCLAQYAACVKAFAYPAYDILLVDNSPSDAYSKAIADLGLPVIRGPSDLPPKDRIVASRNLLRDAALKGGYDYLLSMEQDVVAPADTIARLVAHARPYVTTVVMNTKTINGQRVVYPMVCVPHERLPGRVRPLTRAEIMSGELLPIASAHLACTLIRKDLLMAHRFRRTEKAYDDVIFCNDARAQGAALLCDPTLQILHWPG